MKAHLPRLLAMDEMMHRDAEAPLTSGRVYELTLATTGNILEAERRQAWAENEEARRDQEYNSSARATSGNAHPGL
jgi:hypothetical protein